MFKSKIFLMSFAAVLGSALIGLMISNSTDAANPEEVVVQVAFAAPITVTAETSALQFGTLDVGMLAAETVTINPDDTFSEVPAGGVLGGLQRSGKVDATATPGRPINILVDTITPGSAQYTLTAFICDYNGGADLPCDGAGMSAVAAVTPPNEIRIGATLTAAGGAVAGDDDGTFEVTVAYE